MGEEEIIIIQRCSLGNWTESLYNYPTCEKSRWKSGTKYETNPKSVDEFDNFSVIWFLIESTCFICKRLSWNNFFLQGRNMIFKALGEKFYYCSYRFWSFLFFLEYSILSDLNFFCLKKRKEWVESLCDHCKGHLNWK